MADPTLTKGSGQRRVLRQTESVPGETQRIRAASRSFTSLFPASIVSIALPPLSSNAVVARGYTTTVAREWVGSKSKFLLPTQKVFRGLVLERGVTGAVYGLPLCSAPVGVGFGD